MAINCNKKENKSQERQMMQIKSVVHHQTTDALPVPGQQPAANLPPALYAECDTIW